MRLRKEYNPFTDAEFTKDASGAVSRGSDSTALTVIEGKAIEPSYTAVVVALDKARGNVGVASDLLGVRLRDLQKYVNRHKELKEIVSDFRLKLKYKAEQNEADEIENGNLAVSVRFLEREEAKASKTPKQELTFDELREVQRQALMDLVRLLPKEVVMQALEDRSKTSPE